jgi:hypothetical protein
MSATALPTRQCDRCGARLASYNRGSRCGPCGTRVLRQPPEVPREFWDTPGIRDALATLHMGRVIYVYRNHPWHQQALKQSVVAGWFGLTQAQLSRIETGRAPEEISKLRRWARLLGIPAELLWFKVPSDGSTPLTEASVGAPSPDCGRARSVAPSSMMDVDRELDEVAAHAIQFSQCPKAAMTIELLDEQVRSLARDYLSMPPLPIVRDAAGISRIIYGMLSGALRKFVGGASASP